MLQVTETTPANDGGGLTLGELTVNDLFRFVTPVGAPNANSIGLLDVPCLVTNAGFVYLHAGIAHPILVADEARFVAPIDGELNWQR